jgi:two-component system response regulator (stage 0 sporulation protein A)
MVCYPGRKLEEVTGSVEMQKLLIADAVEEFRQALAEEFRGAYRLRVCREGRETLEMILAFKPDILVLDMMLPGLDGVSILEEVSKAGLHPTVLAVTKLPTDYVVNAAVRLGVGYLMVKPCNVKATVERVRDLSQQVEIAAATPPDPRTEVSNVLLSLGFSTKLRGYHYLREAILEMLRAPGQSVTKELYPAVGKLCDATGIQVERSIRNAISKAWERRDESLWQMYFLKGAGDLLKRPTNAELISAIANRLALDWQNP